MYNKLNIIPVDMVKSLRSETGAGMMDCKRILSRFGGDYEFAKEFMVHAGSAVNVKSDRDNWNLRLTKKYLGRDPFVDHGFKD